MQNLNYLKGLLTYRLFIWLFSLLVVSSHLNAKSSLLFDFKTSKKIVASRVDNRVWNEWLSRNVSAKGYVNYRQGKKQISKIEKYLKYLLSIDAMKLGNVNEMLAYYINLYNTAVVYGVLKKYPLRSVMKIKGVRFFKLSFYLNNKRISIDELEKKIILPIFKEPLVHFVLNCASYSCPPLRNRAYTGKKLKSQLVKQTKLYLKNKEFARVDAKNKTLHIIELFKWYKSDLGDARLFYKRYGQGAGARVPKNLNSYKIKFISYNWDLNGK